MLTTTTPKTTTIHQRKSLNAPAQETVAAALAKMLEELGVAHAFGIPGGAMAAVWGALSGSNIAVHNYRHEGGAAFAATEAHFASGKPIIVFTTAGPGITNALTGLLAARDEGAKVILLSACTSAAQRGRGAIQETSAHTMPTAGIFTAGEIFHYAAVLEHPAQLAQVHSRLAEGLSRPGGFVAHISVPSAVQSALLPVVPRRAAIAGARPCADAATIAQVAAMLAGHPFNIWLGFGARDAAKEVQALAALSGAPVMCSPRAKGIFPEDHPQYIGVTGLGGHSSVFQSLAAQRPAYTLVLGSRLGEPTSFWNPALAPSGGFIHVDVNPTVFNAAYPDVRTLGVQSDIRLFLQTLLAQDTWANYTPQDTAVLVRPEELPCEDAMPQALVRPEALMAAIQHYIVDAGEAIVLAECGNSFTWATHGLRFMTPGRYRVSTGVGAMGHGVTGVVGAATATAGKAVVITGDGSMLMNNEVNTAVKYGAKAVWIVLNDARYNMCHQGMKVLGMSGADALIPEVDFAAMARSMGADGVRVQHESELDAALVLAMRAEGPFVVDVLIDPERMAPSKGRNAGLAAQGAAVDASSIRSFPNN